MTNTTEFFVFKAKTNTEIITFHLLQTYKKCLLDLDSFIIYFIYCLFLKTSIFTVSVIFPSLFILSFPLIFYFSSYFFDLLSLLIYSHINTLVKILPLANIRINSMSAIRITELCGYLFVPNYKLLS